ncbi:two-component system, OmpR family, phosphate regulon sensor histidine kinase PhoR [Sporobacter termitidis DSM 10068]|uniref:histidine kinase n=1 Tax=Sporobacter termitidis DSM 10068 TaxID=1123282 RepID=A0A1M5VCW9_9FIRM|nr:ATP-binding protein [Sporobacter termitidis]SHH72763.1 two-component system, OmpR family, phosphate regulon sensor histidine kinase PhoR [Sporobacter termitidis DSM 10068]
MSKRIFQGIFLVAVAVFLACLLLILGVVYSYYSGEYGDRMEKETAFITRAVELNGLDYLNGMPAQTELRVTWIAADGTVLYDNFADPATMENHGSRPEVQAALATGVGRSDRDSKTLSEQMIYYALRLNDGTVLRTAEAEKTMFTLLPGLVEPFVIVLVTAVVFSLLLAFRISRSIIRPINAIDFEHPERSRVYPELSPLISRIAQQNSIIAKQMDELKIEHEAREKMRREFTANVSHELKTPLTSISGFAEIMKGGLVKSEDIPRFSGYIYDEAQRLISLVGDIIKLSQLDDNELPVKKVRLDLYDACASVVASLKPAADAKGVRFVLSGEHAEIFGAEQIVDEIIHNLCDNAIKYNKDNGSVFVSVTKREGEVELSVSDTGIGIPKSEQTRVFERFYRVNKSNSKQLGGTGLGLSIVKHGAAYHNAKIILESVPDVGTTVKIVFKTETAKGQQ